MRNFQTIQLASSHATFFYRKGQFPDKMTLETLVGGTIQQYHTVNDLDIRIFRIFHSSINPSIFVNLAIHFMTNHSLSSFLNFGPFHQHPEQRHVVYVKLRMLTKC